VQGEERCFLGLVDDLPQTALRKQLWDGIALLSPQPALQRCCWHVSSALPHGVRRPCRKGILDGVTLGRTSREDEASRVRWRWCYWATRDSR
jgi:transposase-like protein